MILACNFEEVSSLRHGARAYLEEGSVADFPVAAPSATRGAVEALLVRLTGDVTVTTLADQRELERGLRAVVGLLRKEMEGRVLQSHPAAEEAVSAYFDFAHGLSVLGRVVEMGAEMQALVEVMTGGVPDEVTIRTFVFPD
jgi:hypothetical protein